MSPREFNQFVGVLYGMSERYAMGGVDRSDEQADVLRSLLMVMNIVRSVNEYVTKEAYLDIEVILHLDVGMATNSYVLGC